MGKYYKIAFAGLLITMISCRTKSDSHDSLIGLWEGTVVSQDFRTYLSASLEFRSIDAEKQEASAVLIFADKSADAEQFSGTIKGLQINLQNENYGLYGALSADSSAYSGKIFRVREKDSLSFSFRNPKFFYSATESVEDKDNTPQIPQITSINKSPDRLTKDVKTYNVTIATEGKKVTLENTEFSLDGKDWQKSAEFKNIACGKYTFHARNRRDKSLQDQKEMFFECFVDVPTPTIAQINELLKQIADCDDHASDELRKYGKNLPVRGVTKIGNIEQLVRDACINGVIYAVQRIETDNSGNLQEITVNNEQ